MFFLNTPGSLSLLEVYRAHSIFLDCPLPLRSPALLPFHPCGNFHVVVQGLLVHQLSLFSPGSPVTSLSGTLSTVSRRMETAATAAGFPTLVLTRRKHTHVFTYTISLTPNGNLRGTGVNGPHFTDQKDGGLMLLKGAARVQRRGFMGRLTPISTNHGT